jgi:hypothetical protein
MAESFPVNFYGEYLPKTPMDAALIDDSRRRLRPNFAFSLLISLLAGNFVAETGSTWTASASFGGLELTTNQ